MRLPDHVPAPAMGARAAQTGVRESGLLCHGQCLAEPTAPLNSSVKLFAG